MKRGAFFDRAREVWVCVLRFLAGNTFSLLQISILRPDLSNLQKAKNHLNQPEIKFSLNRMFSFIPQSFLFLILIFFTIKTENGKKNNKTLVSSQKEMYYFYFIYFSSAYQQKTQLFVPFFSTFCLPCSNSLTFKELCKIVLDPADGGDCVSVWLKDYCTFGKE